MRPAPDKLGLPLPAKMIETNLIFFSAAAAEVPYSHGDGLHRMNRYLPREP